MISFIKYPDYDYSKDDFYHQINDILGYGNTKIKGSYIKYGKDKVCDIDLNENIKYTDVETYIKKIYSNKNKFYFIKGILNVPYHKLEIIKNKIGYINGIFEKVSKESILNDIDNLPNDLKDPLNNLIQIYINTKNINDYIKILIFIDDNLYPKWTLKELLKGTKIYHDQIYNISDYNYDYLYIEIIYDNYRISNMIEFKSIKHFNDYLIFEILEITYNNQISYYRLLKKFLVFIKWLYFKKKVKNSELNNSIIPIYNEINKFIEKLGTKYSKYCILNNKIYILYHKINKYNNKKKKNNKQIYDKLITKYYNKIELMKKKYIKFMNKLNNKCKKKYMPYYEKFNEYLKNYYRIV